MGILGRSCHTDRPRNDLNWPWDESGLFISPFSKIRTIFFEANVSLLIRAPQNWTTSTRTSTHVPRAVADMGRAAHENFPDLYCDAIHKTCNTALRHMSIQTIISNKKDSNSELSFLEFWWQILQAVSPTSLLRHYYLVTNDHRQGSLAHSSGQT